MEKTYEVVYEIVVNMNKKIGELDGKVELILDKLDELHKQNIDQNQKLDYLEGKVTTHETYFRLMGLLIGLIVSILTLVFTMADKIKEVFGF